MDAFDRWAEGLIRCDVCGSDNVGDYEGDQLCYDCGVFQEDG